MVFGGCMVVRAGQPVVSVRLGSVVVCGACVPIGLFPSVAVHIGRTGAGGGWCVDAGWLRVGVCALMFGCVRE